MDSPRRLIWITPSLAILESELKFDFLRASGPGGQKVNKASVAVQLRFDVENSPSLPEEIRERLKILAGSRLTEAGVLVIDARRFRSQAKNRQDAIQRLSNLIRKASQKPKPRRKTKPTLASTERRLVKKRQRSEIKRLRKPIRKDGDFE